jgi:hypothetical protein
MLSYCEVGVEAGECRGRRERRGSDEVVLGCIESRRIVNSREGGSCQEGQRVYYVLNESGKIQLRVGLRKRFGLEFKYGPFRVVTLAVESQGERHTNHCAHRSPPAHAASKAKCMQGRKPRKARGSQQKGQDRDAWRDRGLLSAGQSNLPWFRQRRDGEVGNDYVKPSAGGMDLGQKKLGRHSALLPLPDIQTAT